MKTLLILPSSGYKHGYPSFFSSADFPAGFAYIAAAIRHSGHEVVGLNPNNDASYESAYEMVQDKITKSLSENKPDLIGLGGLSTDYKFIKDAMHIIREKSPDTPIVMGGGIINCDTEFIFSRLKPDFCVIGEAEETLVHLINMLESGEQDYGKITNLGYWDKGRPVFTERNFDYVELDKRPFPDYEPFGIHTMLDEYSMATRYVYRYTRPNPRPMTIVSARGCPFSCSFCVDKKYGKYRSRSLENIMQEIKELYDKYHFNILIILDELFVARKERLKEFCTALIEAREKNGWDFDWIFQTHASSSLDSTSFELAKKAGCYCFTYGVESASPRVLESMNKRSKPSQIAEALNIADTVGLGFYAAFIFGDVAETTETIQESMRFFTEHCSDTHIYSAAIQPYPGSRLFEHCLKKDLIGNRIDYYEHIDEQIFNMTQIPNRIWFPWSYLVLYLWRFFQFAKSAKATSCEIDTNAFNDPIALYYKKNIYKIKAICPHCANENEYREMLVSKDETVVDTTNNGIWMSMTSLLRRIVGLNINKYNMPKLILKGSLYLLTSFRHPIFKTLNPLIGESEIVPFFTTGCQNCNKRITIRISSGNIDHRFNSIRNVLNKVLSI